MPKYDSFSKKTRRLAGYDYRWGGLYFITICTKDRLTYFGEVKNGQTELSDEGLIAHAYWLELEQHWPDLFLGEFVIMPNHVYGIIGLEVPVQDIGSATAEEQPKINHDAMAALSPKAGSISRIIGSYKAACTNMIRSVSTEPFGWQHRFHDRIIRNSRELHLIENYIISNPSTWEDDQFYK